MVAACGQRARPFDGRGAQFDDESGPFAAAAVIEDRHAVEGLHSDSRRLPFPHGPSRCRSERGREGDHGGSAGRRFRRRQPCASFPPEMVQRRYFTARNRLVDAGLLVRGRGYGGSVRLATTDVPSERTVSVVVPAGADPVATIEASVKNELSLYEPMKSVIIGEWARDRQTDPLAVEITALQG